jgi:hypothetical protein
VVDKVRSSLSYNDIVVSRNANILNDDSNAEAKEIFLNKLFSIIVGDIFKQVALLEARVRYCIESRPIVMPDGSRSRTRVMDSTFYLPDMPNCLRLSVVKGMLDCKFYMQDGLDSEAAVVLAYMKIQTKGLVTNATKQPVGWRIQKSLIPDPSLVRNTSKYREVKTNPSYSLCCNDLSEAPVSCR